MKLDRIIPAPRKCERKDGVFDFATLTDLRVDEELKSADKLLRDQLGADLGRALGNGDGVAVEVLYRAGLPAENYRLEVAQGGIKIYASDVRGAVYGVQTLRMATLADLRAGRGAKLACATVEDGPRFGWRGLQIDEARHFFGEDEIKKVLDLMCLHKLNVLHWHLTDDQGWRIEIKKYPLLTEIGGRREKSQINGWMNKEENDIPVVGWYTQEQIRGIVAYAAERGIDIVPEIDMPAHLAAAMAAYPWLGCRELERPVPWYFGATIPLSLGIKDWNRSACVGSPRTMQFIRDVIDEITELFPFGYFHIGGDEVPKDEWKKCPVCNAEMKKHGFGDYKQLHTHFINTVGDYVATKGRKLIGWNEILHGGNLNNDVLVQYWTPQPDPRVAGHLNRGGKVIISKHKHFYFDMPYAQYPLKNTYKFTPYFGGINKRNVGGVLGVEGELWSEWIDSAQKLEFQMNPRLAALSEVAWDSEGKKDYKRFEGRLEEYFAVLDALGVAYAKPHIFRGPKNPFARVKKIRTWYGKDMNTEFSQND